MGSDPDPNDIESGYGHSSNQLEDSFAAKNGKEEWGGDDDWEGGDTLGDSRHSDGNSAGGKKDDEEVGSLEWAIRESLKQQDGPLQINSRDGKDAAQLLESLGALEEQIDVRVVSSPKPDNDKEAREKEKREKREEMKRAREQRVQKAKEEKARRKEQKDREMAAVEAMLPPPPRARAPKKRG